MLYCRYLPLFSNIVICTIIYKIACIYCCYQSFLYVKLYSVLLVCFCYQPYVYLLILPVLLLSIFGNNHFYMYNSLQYWWYPKLLTMNYICKNICSVAEINICHHFYINKNLQNCFYILLLTIIYMYICIFAGIYLWYQYILYVQTSAVLQVTIVAINQCYMYKFLQYCSNYCCYNNCFKCKIFAVLLVHLVAMYHCHMYKHIPYCQYLCC